MECLLQYLDDLDDLYGMLGLQFERLRATLAALLALGICTAVAAAAAWLARLQPQLALAACCLMAVALLYRAATGLGSARPAPVGDLQHG